MSIITEALKKAEKERNKVIDSKEYLNKILGPQIDMSAYQKEVFARTDEELVSPVSYEEAESADRAPWRPRRSLIISGLLIVGAIIFLSAMNILIISSPDVERATSGRSAKSSRNSAEAETYTTAMQPDINLIERKATILDKMGRVLTGSVINDEFASNFTLNGIIYDADNSWAIINNRMVRTGDVLDGAKVLSITPQKVVLLFKKETFDLIVK